MSGDRIYREGDKVMQIKNNYQLEWEIVSRYGIPVERGAGVFNGDLLPVVDPVGVHDDVALLRLPENPLQLHHGKAPAADEVPQHLSRPHAGRSCPGM